MARSSTSGTQNGGGRKRHDPTPEQRTMVEAMAAFGIKTSEIASIVGITERLLFKKYKTELAQGSPKAIFNVAQSLYQIAIDKKHPDCARAASFYLKTRARWTTVHELMVTGDPANIDKIAKLASLKLLTKDELVELEKIAERLERSQRAEVESSTGVEGQPNRVAHLN